MLDFIRHKIGLLKAEYRLFRYKNRFGNSRIYSLLDKKIESLIREYTLIEAGVVIKGNVRYLGKGLYIGSDTQITSCDHIGDYCSISSHVKIGLRNHPMDWLSTSPVFYSKRRGLVADNLFDGRGDKRTWIGHDVLISANVLIMHGVEIGTGAIIGAGAVVTTDIPPYAIAVGVPAKVTSYRFEEPVREALMQSEWWKKDPETIRQLPYFKQVDQVLQRNSNQ